MSRRRFVAPPRESSDPPDDTGCTILHVDMDAFYASATLRTRPELHGRPVIIGGSGRSVVLSATYEARAHGVTSAMPMARAVRLCPEAVVLPPEHALYAEISRAVMAVFHDVTPLVEPLSLDEAFLDVSGAIRLLGNPASIGAAIRARVEDEQGITCSVGVAPTKFLAKIASGLAKPDGMIVVPVAEAVTFVRSLPVGALWGVGDRTEERLVAAGIRTVADIATARRADLERAVGLAAAAHLRELADGRDPRRVQPERAGKSIGSNRTFETDLTDADDLDRALLALAGRTCARARAQGVLGRTVALSVRWSDFTTVTRSRTLEVPTDSTRTVHRTAAALLAELAPRGRPVRLLGVRLEQLSDASVTPVQVTLDEPEHGWRDAERAADRIGERFGSGAVRPASLLGEGRPSSRRQGPGLS